MPSPLPILLTTITYAFFSNTITTPTTTDSNTTQVSNFWHLKGTYLTMRLGPTMIYSITEYEPPSRFVLVGEGSALAAIDTITFEARETGTDITYEADLRFKGLTALLMPFLGGVTRGVGRKAVEGLQKALTP